MFISRRFHLGRLKAVAFLEELANTPGRAMTLYLPRGTSEDRAQDLVKRISGGTNLAQEVAELAAGWELGAAFFWSPRQAYLVLPPFPITEEHVATGHDIIRLRSLLTHDFVIALILIRLGAYSVGICRGTELIDSKTGTGLVHARHKKGGRSQARFARHRERQIEEFLERACAHIRQGIGPYARSIDYLVYGGARTTILSLRKRCAFLDQFDDRVLRTLADIPRPRQSVLEKAIATVWSTEVIELSGGEP